MYEIRSTFKLLKCEDVQELLKLVREKTVMSLEEGRLLILHLFTLGEQYILVRVIIAYVTSDKVILTLRLFQGIHNNVKVVLQKIVHTNINDYADLYVTAWLNATEKLRKFIVENCFQNIVFHCFRAYRNSAGRGKLGKNLLSFLIAIHNSKNQTVRLMIHDQCKSLLWNHIKVLITKNVNTYVVSIHMF